MSSHIIIDLSLSYIYIDVSVEILLEIIWGSVPINEGNNEYIFLTVGGAYCSIYKVTVCNLNDMRF